MKILRKKLLIALSCIVLFAALCFAGLTLPAKPQTASAAAEAEPSEQFEENGLIVTLSSEASSYRGIKGEVEDILRKTVAVEEMESITELPERYLNADGSLNEANAPTLTAQYKERPFLQVLHLKLQKSGETYLNTAIDALEQLAEVNDVGFNWMIKKVDQTDSAAIAEAALRSNRWNMRAGAGINAEAAWTIARGARSVRVGVIDSGIAEHEDLKTNLDEGYDFYNENTITTDDPIDHGTHVAGIIGATGTNSAGVTGVAPAVTLVPLQSAYDTTKSGSSYIQDIVEAINYATSTWEDSAKRISILNYSILHYGWSKQENIIAAVNNYPGLFVWIAGNEGKNVDDYPDISKFKLPNIISVGATDVSGDRWADSCFGNSVDIYAPGEGIYSTTPDGYNYKSGTSMAAPHVSGTAALVLSINPGITAPKLRELLLESADTIDISTPIGMQTVKKLNAYQAVTYADPINELFDGGYGSRDNPYQIRTEQQFRNIEYAVRDIYVPREGNVQQITSSFRLMNDIVLSGDWTPFSHKFTGYLDGNGHSVTYQMEISAGDATALSNQGLFSRLCGTVENLTLLNCSIKSDSISAEGNFYLGILAGAVNDPGSLNSVKIVNPTIDCRVENSGVGGIAGYINASTKNCEVIGGSLKNRIGSLGGMAGYGDIYSIHGGKVATTIGYPFFGSLKKGKVIGVTEQTSDVDVRDAVFFCFDG